MASEGPLNRLARVLRRAQDDLNGLGLDWALIGGLAVAVRAEPRFTRDVDLAVAVADDREAESLIFQLQSYGYQSVLHQPNGELINGCGRCTRLAEDSLTVVEDA